MKKALLVIDVQNEYFSGKMKVTYPDNSFKNILMIMEHAKSKDMPIIIVQHTKINGDTFIRNTEGWKVHPEILKKHYDYFIEKTKPSSFYKTNLDEILKNEDIEGIVISGYMTQMCCDTTAREAFHKGFHVDFLSDGTGTIDVNNSVGVISGKELHHAAIMAQSLGFSNVIGCEEWMSEN